MTPKNTGTAPARTTIGALIRSQRGSMSTGEIMQSIGVIAFLSLLGSTVAFIYDVEPESASTAFVAARASLLILGLAAASVVAVYHTRQFLAWYRSTRTGGTGNTPGAAGQP